MLARRHRLTRGSDYRLVVRRGIRSGAPHVVTSVLTTGEHRPPRFGFIVSKQVGTAVTRNTVRRRLKAVCAAALPSVPEGTDVVIRALPASARATFAELAADVDRAFARVEAKTGTRS
ncbi:ribonuclease P protein component [Microbacterium sp. NIBRBAC000506063]|uniref:ribonuclease P protein component n=1 Tax=Microbacterium sp. NIBRBAC000506063 TaxID=2734618 RepID=UPI001BB6D73E|nr:ribonuclease P protein component [Microbacterium sp. NIBRBAC000506063]QTV80421.1 ribonuclease P protein component [Microbacterium sp. NIBRBAC000506063]